MVRARQSGSTGFYGLALRFGSGSALRQAGQMIFEEFGGSPGNSYTWVELRDDLTVSLLQARLIELNLPINVAVGTRG